MLKQLMNEKKEDEEKPEDIFETVVEFTGQELEEMRNEAREKAKQTHNWVQRGIWLVCTSCEFEHGHCIGVNKRLKGIDKEGNPILEDRADRKSVG